MHFLQCTFLGLQVHSSVFIACATTRLEAADSTNWSRKKNCALETTASKEKPLAEAELEVDGEPPYTDDRARLREADEMWLKGTNCIGSFQTTSNKLFANFKIINSNFCY